MEVDDNGITTFVGVGLVIVDVSVSLEMTLVVPWYVERKGDLSWIFHGDRSVDISPECGFAVRGGLHDGGSSLFPLGTAISSLEHGESSEVVSYLSARYGEKPTNNRIFTEPTHRIAALAE
jgi:hypothetical protein